MRLLKVLAVLLNYPSAALVAAAPELRQAIDAEPGLSRTDRAALTALTEELERTDLLDLQVSYSRLFDHGRATSLNLFEHLHGESRERGAALVELKALYARHGLQLASTELPDALPVFLEFLSCLPRDAATVQLRDAGDAIRAIGEALAARGSRYAAVPQTLLSIARLEGLSPRRAPPPEPPPDAEWADAPVSFAPPATVASQVMRFIRRGTKPGA